MLKNQQLFRLLQLLLRLGALSLFTSCLTINTLQPARTLEPGQGSFIVAAGSLKTDYKVFGEKDSYSFPIIEGMYRLGVLNDLDIGIRLVNFSSIVVDTKYQLIRGDFDLSTGLSIGYASISVGSTESTTQSKASTTFIDIRWPIYSAYNVSDNFALLLSPSVTDRIVRSSSGATNRSRNFLFIGGSGGLKLGHRWGLIAEYGWMKPIMGTETANDEASMSEITVGLFFTWGHPKQTRDELLREGPEQKDQNDSEEPKKLKRKKQSPVPPRVPKKRKTT